MKRLFLDKTGTLTEDKPHRVATVAANGGVPNVNLVSMAFSLARWSSHPLAKALADGASEVESADRTASFDWQDVEEQVGQGMQANLPDGSHWRLGSRAWVESGTGQVPSLLRDASASLAPDVGLPCVWFGAVGNPSIRFDFDERVRPEAQAAVQALQADGIAVGLLSGDDVSRVKRVATRLRLDTWTGGASPEDKLDQVALAQARGERVGMVGDGVNDAPVLAQADISFAMGQGALVSRLNADAVIVSNRLDDVVFARRLAKRTVAVVRQNLVWAAVYNGACIPLALAGYLPPWAAGLGMAFSSLLVVGNSLRLAR
jgi:Cu2+-exporting ATPase